MTADWMDTAADVETVTVKDGSVSATFRVGVLYASEDSYHDMVRGNVTDLRACLRVSTLTTYDDGNPVAIRKRDYNVDTVFCRTGRAEYPWITAAREHHDRGVRNDNGGVVEHGSATRKQLDRLAVMARDEYIAAHPDWERVSVRLYYLAKIQREQLEIDNARELVNRHTVKQDEWRAKLDKHVSK